MYHLGFNFGGYSIVVVILCYMPYYSKFTHVGKRISKSGIEYRHFLAARESIIRARSYLVVSQSQRGPITRTPRETQNCTLRTEKLKHSLHSKCIADNAIDSNNNQITVV